MTNWICPLIKEIYVRNKTPGKLEALFKSAVQIIIKHLAKSVVEPLTFKVILCSYLILEKMNKYITDS